MQIAVGFNALYRRQIIDFHQDDCVIVEVSEGFQQMIVVFNFLGTIAQDTHIFSGKAKFG